MGGFEFGYDQNLKLTSLNNTKFRLKNRGVACLTLYGACRLGCEDIVWCEVSIVLILRIRFFCDVTLCTALSRSRRFCLNKRCDSIFKRCEVPFCKPSPTVWQQSAGQLRCDNKVQASYSVTTKCRPVTVWQQSAGQLRCDNKVQASYSVTTKCRPVTVCHKVQTSYSVTTKCRPLTVSDLFESSALSC